MTNQIARRIAVRMLVAILAVAATYAIIQAWTVTAPDRARPDSNFVLYPR